VQRLVDPALSFHDLAEARDLLLASSELVNELSPAHRYGPPILLTTCLALRHVDGLLHGVPDTAEASVPEGNSASVNGLLYGLAGLVLWAFLFCGSLWCSLVGLEVRLLKGGRASRLRCALQSAASRASVMYFIIILEPTYLFDVNPWLLCLYFPLLALLPPAGLLIAGTPGRTAAGGTLGTCFARGPQRRR
jgi:hypothetical protein